MATPPGKQNDQGKQPVPAISVPLPKAAPGNSEGVDGAGSGSAGGGTGSGGASSATGGGSPKLSVSTNPQQMASLQAAGGSAPPVSNTTLESAEEEEPESEPKQEDPGRAKKSKAVDPRWSDDFFIWVLQHLLRLRIADLLKLPLMVVMVPLQIVMVPFQQAYRIAQRVQMAAKTAWQAESKLKRGVTALAEGDTKAQMWAKSKYRERQVRKHEQYNAELEKQAERVRRDSDSMSRNPNSEGKHRLSLQQFTQYKESVKQLEAAEKAVQLAKQEVDKKAKTLASLEAQNKQNSKNGPSSVNDAKITVAENELHNAKTQLKEARKEYSERRSDVERENKVLRTKEQQIEQAKKETKKQEEQAKREKKKEEARQKKEEKKKQKEEKKKKKRRMSM